MKSLPNLLIVDDNPDQLRYLEIVLKKLKINLIKAESGFEALEKTKGLALALAIIDVQMPEINGYELAEQIIEERSGKKIPIIFLTALHVSEMHVFKGYSSGAVDYMIKPVNINILISKVKIFLDLFNQKLTIIRKAAKLKESADELARLNTELKKSKEKYQSYIESAPDGVFVSDETGKFIEVNGAACRITGYSNDELLKMSILDIFPEESIEDGLAYLRKLIKTGRSNADLVFRHKNGTHRWWTLDAVKLTETQFLKFAKDITIRIALEESLRNHQLELELQNEQTLFSKEQAEVAAKKYTELFDFAPSGCFVLSSDFIIKEVNNHGANLLGRKQSNLVGCHFSSFVSDDTLPTLNAFLLNVFISKAKESCELIFEAKGKQKKHVHIEGIVTGNGEQCILNVEDITVRKQDEKEKAQISARLQLATRAGGVGVWDMDFDSNNLIWDDQMFYLYGVDKKNFNNSYLSWLVGIHPDDKERSDEEIQMALRGEKEFDTEFRVLWADGTIHNIRAIAIVQRDAAGKPIRMIGTNWDITQQKTLEESLISSEANFRTFFETMNDIIIVSNEQGKIIYSNEALSKKLGYTKEDLQRIHVLDLNPAEMRAEAEQIFTEMFAGKRNVCPLPLVRKDGSLIPAETKVWFGKWHGNDCIFGFSRDLSKEQEALQRFNKIFESNPAPMAISTFTKGVFTDVNAAFLSLTGYKKDEVIGKTAADLNLFIQPEEQSAAAVELAENGSIHNLRLQLKTKSENILEGLFSGEVIESFNEKFLLTVMTDITERVLAEAAIKESESNLLMAQQIAHMGSWNWDLISNTIRFSEGMYNIFDLSSNSFDGKPESLVKLIHPDDIDNFTDVMKRSLSDFDSTSFEFRVIHKDGSIHNMIGISNTKFDDKGKPTEIIGTVQDISERKQIESEMNLHREMLQVIFDNIPVMILFFEGGRNISIANREVINKLGWTFEEWKSKNIIEKSYPNRKDYEEVFEFMNSNQLGWKDFKCTTKFGNELLISWTNIRLPIGDMLSFGIDVTGSKEAELKLIASEAKYKTILQSSPDGILLTDMNGLIDEISEIGIKLLNANSRDEIAGKYIFDFCPDDNQHIIRELFERTISEGLTLNTELLLKKLDESLFQGEISATLLQQSDGTPFSLLFVIRDISARRNSEMKQIHSDRMANLGVMASGIAHEINQPLNIISLVLDKILLSIDNPETFDIKFINDKADRIFENIIRIRNIIDRVRDFSTSRSDFISSAFDPNLSVNNAVLMISEQLKHIGINLNLQLTKQIPQIVGNIFQLEQVVVNLLLNAKDAVMERKDNDNDYAEMEIGIRSYQDGQFIIIEVVDNGIGIRDADINNVMLPFYTTKDVGKGTGLGLPICYQIIKQMHGTIEISSAYLSGTKIKLILKIQ